MNVRIEDLPLLQIVGPNSIMYISSNGSPFSYPVTGLITGIIGGNFVTPAQLLNSSGVLQTQINTVNTTINTGFVPTNPVGAIIRFVPTTGLQWFNFTTNLWHTLLCVNNPPQFAWDAGQT